jgi:hypothetical protein
MKKGIRSAATQEQRDEIRRSLHELVEQLATGMLIDPCAVAVEVCHYHQRTSNPYRTTTRQRFINERRGFSAQHRPPNRAAFSLRHPRSSHSEN